MNPQAAINLAAPLIKAEETFQSKAYWDVNGYAIGYGNHTGTNGKAVQKGDVISRSDAEQLVMQTIADKEQAIRPYIKADLSDYQYAAIISLTYNCGEGNVSKSTLLKMINQNPNDPAIDGQFVKTCVTAKGQYMDILYQRRTHELALYSTYSQTVAAVKEMARENPKSTAAIVIGMTAAVGAGLWWLWKTKRA